MTEAIGQTLAHKTQEAPRPKEKLSDEEMGNLLSAVGNHEAKAITLILMRDGNIYDAGNLHGKVLNAQRENKGWIMNRTTPFYYCRRSLAPIGLVAQETLNSDLSTYGYQITPKGKELGVPLAGLLLDFSERHNIPLNLLFGATASSSEEKNLQTEKGKVEFRKRAPSTTLKILFEILTSSSLPIRETDLGEQTGEYPAEKIAIHLIRLSKLGLIEYRTAGVNKSWLSYKLSSNIPEGELPIYKAYKALTQSVFKVLKENPDKYLTSDDVCSLLPKEQQDKRKKKRELMNSVSCVLSHLNKHNYADNEKFNMKKHSEINITDEQGIILTELLEIIYSFQNQNEEVLEKGKRLAEKFIVNPIKVSRLLRRAKEASSNASQSAIEETQQRLLSILASYPEGLTTKEMQMILEKKYDKKLGTKRINELSSFLVGSGFIKVKKEGQVNKFYPNNETSSVS